MLLPKQAKGEGNNEPRLRLPPVELKQLPLKEALRQVLIERAGSLRQAYAAMDVDKSGEVDVQEFDLGLRALRIFGSPLHEFHSVQSLFDSLDEGHGVLSLQDILDYIPTTRPFSEATDTRALWVDYHNKASAQRSQLARRPCWDIAELPADLAPEKACREAVSPLAAGAGFPEEQSALALHRRRELRRQFREAIGVSEGAKRRQLVRGAVQAEASLLQAASEQWKIQGQRERIEDAIRGCGRARHALVDMQRMMAGLAPNDFKELREALMLK